MKKSVLIIDDESKLRELTAKLLTYEGFLVYQAENIRKGRKLVELNHPEVVLCDVKLPDGNGVDFCIELKSSLADTEFILFTAFGDIQDVLLNIFLHR